MDWSLLWMALGLALVFEGLPWFLAPERAVQAARAMQQLPAGVLRWLGFAALLGGAALLVLGRAMR